MLYNQETKNKIEDALVHFEDAGYTFHINNLFGNKAYDFLKGISTNDEVEFGDKISISLYQKDDKMSWKEYQWYQSEFKTAISRMTDDLDRVTISNTTDYKTLIEIKCHTWNFKNIKKLTEKTRYFNSNNNLSDLIVYPEYHVNDGIALYVSEKPNQRRFDIFNCLLKGDNTSIEGVFGERCIINMYEEGEAEKENPHLINSRLSKNIVAKLNCDFIKV